MKITTETVARLARTARRATAGAYGLAEAARPGKPAKVTDTAAGLTWQGPDALRQAAAFYAGLIDQLTDPTPGPVLAVVAEVRARHGNYITDGRDAAATVRAGAR